MFGNTYDPDNDIPDLSGKVYIVTGGTAGIGFGITAHLLQHHPKKIYILSKKEEHAEDAQKELKEWGDISKVEWKKCDFEDLKQVDEVAKELAKNLDQLDALICNAGLGIGPYNESKDGLDTHMQVNHFAHFHLALSLLPILQNTPNSRLLMQSSELHRPVLASQAKTWFSSVDEINKDVGAASLYNRTKLAVLMFVLTLTRYQAAGELGLDPAPDAAPYILATHPGAVKTDQTDQAVEAYGLVGKVGVGVVRRFMVDPVKQGCRSMLFAATGPEVVREKLKGAYIIPDRKTSDVSSVAKDEELQDQLWKLSEQVLSDKLGSLPYRTRFIDPIAKEGVRGAP
ncbi:NAD(P)-binding protein [Trichodelitschia bisporula]|uniref:NAD(P)-binding protein n=1 Tax=Trichodelitschia bisporula TaxID=703511 RepID=A0A6G1HI09_9PEZI|nr:NAD(P)-binding protein [Trichodelitschia bisporula]